MPYSRLASPHATRETLERHDLYTRKRLGQHFLVDDNVVGRILGLADLDGSETVLEVGPGIGTLTIALCERASDVIVVETDTRLTRVLADTAKDCGNLTVVMGDAVKVPTRDLQVGDSPPDTFVANLPYSVAATLVLRYFEEIEALSSAVGLGQAEVAARMAAVPGTKDYGAYTVKLSFYAETTGSFSVPRSCFMPPPRVDSTVVRLDRRAETLDGDLIAAASAVVDAGFSQRRKTLRNALKSGLGIDSTAVEQVLHAAGVDPLSRAEVHEPSVFLEIGSCARKYGLLP